MKISAKQFTLKRLLALVCVLVLSITAIQWPIGKAEAASVTSIKLKAVEGITWYTVDEEEMLVDEIEDVDTTSYKYKYNEGYYEIAPLSGQFASKVIFYVESEGTEQPIISPDNGAKVSTKKTTTPRVFKVTVTLTDADGIVTLTPKVKHTVSFILTNRQSKNPDGEIKDIYAVTKNGKDDPLENNKIIVTEESLKFDVKLYENASKVLSVTRNSGEYIPVTGEPSEGNDAGGDYVKYTYEIKQVTDDITITISTSDKAFTVDLPKEVTENYTVTSGGNNIVYYGGSYSFYVTPAEGVNKPEVKYCLSDSKENQDDKYQLLKEVAENNYVIANITNNVWVKIEDSGKKTCNVTLNAGNGYEFWSDVNGTKINENPMSVEYGTKDQKIYVKVDNEHSKSIDRMIVAANNVTLTPSKTVKEDVYKYTIPEIKSDQNITVSGLTINTYDITIIQGKNYTISPASQKVTHGDAFTFTVTPAAGYKIEEEPTATVTMKGNLGASASFSRLANGSYTGTITSVTGDTKIELNENSVKRITYAITVKDNSNDDETHHSKEGVDAYDFVFVTNKDVMTNGDSKSATANEGTDVSFTVTAKEGYHLDQVAVRGTTLTAVNGIYTISAIDRDTTITILTTEYSLKLNYVDNKYKDKYSNNGSVTVWYHDSAFASKGKYALKGKSDVSSDGYYDLVGWMIDGEDEVITEISRDDLGIEKAFTLIAKWDPVWAKFATLTTNEGSVTEQSKDLYKVMYKTFIKFVEGLQNSNSYKTTDIKVTGYGILYGDYEFAPRDKTHMITGRDKTNFEGYQQYYQYNTDDHIVNFYYNIKYETAEQFISGNDLRDESNGLYDTAFSWSFNSTKKGPHYGAGWMELEVNGESMVIFSEKSYGLNTERE